jgi:hypothetical protein
MSLFDDWAGTMTSSALSVATGRYISTLIVVAGLVLAAVPAVTAAAEPGDGQTTTTEPSTAQPAPPTPDLPRPSTAGFGAPRLHGTYNNTSTLNAATVTGINQISSPCGGCNAVVTTNGLAVTAIWTGAGWSASSPAQCGPVVANYIPTSVVDGYVQTASGTTTGMCGVAQPILSTLVRLS